MIKTILITGSTDGIGKQTALQLADRGHHVIVHGRSEAKCLHAIDEIRRRVPSAHLDHCAGDLSSMDSVRALAENVLRKSITPASS
jgi:NAD(P)-dependent dehydrogenase (short-subunit alcohol dehydrogenase family)